MVVDFVHRCVDYFRGSIPRYTKGSIPVTRAYQPPIRPARREEPSLKDIQSLLREVRREALPRAADLAAAAGISYDTWRSWQSGRRNPRARNLLALADVLEAQASKLHALAARLNDLTDRLQSGGKVRSSRRPHWK